MQDVCLWAQVKAPCSGIKVIKSVGTTALLCVSTNWYAVTGIECITSKLELSMDLWKLEIFEYVECFPAEISTSSLLNKVAFSTLFLFPAFDGGVHDFMQTTIWMINILDVQNMVVKPRNGKKSITKCTLRWSDSNQSPPVHELWQNITAWLFFWNNLDLIRSCTNSQIFTESILFWQSLDCSNMVP